MAGLSAYLPRTIHGLVGAALRGEDAFRRERGGVLFCDVAGFTPLTEALSVLGKEGAEELTRLLNGYFTRMIGIIEEEGGDVLRFGGDSMAVLFPGRSADPALRAASRMMGAMGEFATLPTRAGSFKLSMKIGAAFGEVLLGILGDGEGTFEFYAAGLPLDDSAEAEHRAKPGLIICHPTASEACKRGTPMEPHDGGFFRLAGPMEGKPHGKGKIFQPSEDDLARLVPAYLGDYTGEGVSGEHRGTAVLFASFSGIASSNPGGHTAQADLETHRSMESAYRAFSAAARRFGGVVNKLDMGDKGAKALLLFGSPRALENKEEMASRAALELLQGGSFAHAWALRMGLTAAPLFTGPVGSSGRREFTVMGDGINLAARLMQAALPGQVLCDGRVARAASGRLHFEGLPPITVKGKRDPVPLFVPLGEREEDEAPAGALVEREPLCRILREYLLKGGGAPVALVSGPGLGKTALLEWARGEAQRRGLPASRAFLGPYSADRPYAVWRSHLRYILGIRRSDTAETVQKALLDALASEPPEYRNLLNPLLDLAGEEGDALRNLSPKERKDLTFAILGRLLGRSGLRVLLVDNLHWADPLSLEFLGFLLEDPERPPWRMVVTLRPGRAEAEEHLGAMRREEIVPLSKAGVEALLRKRYGFAEMEKGVVEWFEVRSKGNPAVVAALVPVLETAGLLVRDTYGARVDADRLFQTAFPDTLEGIYLTRVDGLPARSRTVLQQASVLGASVSGNLLSHITGLDLDALRETVVPAAEAGILFEDTWGSRPYFRFADALLRDAVYEAMPFSLKREAHLRLAEFLEPESDGNPRLWPTLAHHFEQAGEEGRARAFHRLAGRDAASRSDNATALKHLEYVCRVIEPLVGDIEDAFRLLDVYAFLGRREESRGTLERLRSAWGAMDSSHQGRFLYFQAREAFHERKWDEVESRLLEGLRHYEAAGDITGVGKSYVNLVGLVYGPTGQLDKAKECLEKALALPEGPDQGGFRALAAMNLGAVHKHIGSPEEAVPWFERAYRQAIRGGLGPQKGMIASNLGAIHCEMGHFSKAILWGKRTLDALDTFAVRGVPLFNARYNLSLALLSIGHSQKVHRLLTQLRRQAETSENYQVQAFALQGLSQASAQMGAFSDSLESADQALQICRGIDNGRDFRFILLGITTLFHSLGAPERAIEFWEQRKVASFLAETSPELVPDAGLRRLLEWMGGGSWVLSEATNFLEEGKRVSPEEWLERLLKVAESQLAEGGSRGAAKTLREARRALEAWPHFDAKIRFLGLRTLSGRLSGKEKEEARYLLRQNPGGVWGLRVLCLLALFERGAEDRHRLIRKAQQRLSFCRANSPIWAWEKLSTFPEVAQILKEVEAGKRMRSRKRPGGK
jgi:class 3 adenylate cyclase/tetratricopeptide (TPR) repeat protein